MPPQNRTGCYQRNMAKYSKKYNAELVYTQLIICKGDSVV